MKTMNRIRKLHIIGYLFFIGVTILEILVFKSLFGVGLLTGKMAGVIMTPTLFNISIWCFGIRYCQTKERDD